MLARTGRTPLRPARDLALGDPLLRRPAEALSAGELVAEYELERKEPIDGRAAVAATVAEHERRREVAVIAEIQTLPLHWRLLTSRVELEAAYDARHLCVCPRCGAPRNDDEDPAVSSYHGVRCRCCGGTVVPMVERPELPAELDDSIARIASRRERLWGVR